MESAATVLACVCLALVLSACEAAQSNSYLRDRNNVQNKEHIKEHMSEYYEDGDDLEKELDSEEATQFHFFKLHDYDNNNKLDGLELYSAIRHYSQHGVDADGKEGGASGKEEVDEEQLISVVDSVLELDDFNNDGFIEYYELLRAQMEAMRDNA